MVIRKIDIVNVQLVKGNFVTRKIYRLKFSTRTFIILNFQLKQLATLKIAFLIFYS